MAHRARRALAGGRGRAQIRLGAPLRLLRVPHGMSGRSRAHPPPHRSGVPLVIRLPLPDDAQRVRVRTSHASLAVEASAGTGKTYLLVVRALWLILVKKLPAESIVAVAFGEKAATELRQRLRAKLEEVVRAPSHDVLDPEVLA